MSAIYRSKTIVKILAQSQRGTEQYHKRQQFFLLTINLITLTATVKKIGINLAKNCQSLTLLRWPSAIDLSENILKDVKVNRIACFDQNLLTVVDIRSRKKLLCFKDEKQQFFRIGKFRFSSAHILNRFSSQSIDESIDNFSTNPKKKYWKEFMNQDTLDPFGYTYLVDPQGNLTYIDDISQTYEELIGQQFTHSMKNNSFSLGRIGYTESLREIHMEDKTLLLLDMVLPSEHCQFYLRVSSNLPTLTFEKFQIQEMKKKLTKNSKQFKKFKMLVASSPETTLNLTNLPQSVEPGEYCEFYQFEGFLLVACSVLIIVDINSD